MTINAYILSAKAAWYWTTILLAAATIAAVFTISEDAYPLVYVRYALGAVYVLWLPGYTLTRAMFPVGEPVKNSKENPDALERIGLSIGVSLALDLIVGFLLNQTPWGLRLTPIIASLLALTTTCATVAVTREYLAETRQEQQHTERKTRPQDPSDEPNRKRNETSRAAPTSPVKKDPRLNSIKRWPTPKVLRAHETFIIESCSITKFLISLNFAMRRIS